MEAEKIGKVFWNLSDLMVSWVQSMEKKEVLRTLSRCLA